MSIVYFLQITQYSLSLTSIVVRAMEAEILPGVMSNFQRHRQHYVNSTSQCGTCFTLLNHFLFLLQIDWCCTKHLGAGNQHGSLPAEHVEFFQLRNCPLPWQMENKLAKSSENIHRRTTAPWQWQARWPNLTSLSIPMLFEWFSWQFKCLFKHLKDTSKFDSLMEKMLEKVPWHVVPVTGCCEAGAVGV